MSPYVSSCCLRCVQGQLTPEALVEEQCQAPRSTSTKVAQSEPSSVCHYAQPIYARNKAVVGHVEADFLFVFSTKKKLPASNLIKAPFKRFCAQSSPPRNTQTNPTESKRRGGKKLDDNYFGMRRRRRRRPRLALTGRVSHPSQLQSKLV